MKIALMSPFSRIIINKKSVRSWEALLLEKLVSDYGDDLYYISKKTKDELDNKNYIDIFSLQNLDSFDLVIIHNFNSNIFGGIVSNMTIKFIQLLADYKGKIGYYITDPKLKYFNIPNYLISRPNLYIEKIDGKPVSSNDLLIWKSKFIELEKRMIAFFTGYDYKPIYGLNEKCEVRMLPIFDLILSSQSISQSIDENYIYDIVYYGDNRGSYRNNKILKYLNSENIKSLLIGFELPRLINCTFKNKVPHQELKSAVSQCLSSLVIGDKEHENAFVTFRFYENIVNNVVSFIDIDYDNQKKLFKNQALKDFNYIYNSYDLADKLNLLRSDFNFRKTILKLQREEYVKIQ